MRKQFLIAIVLLTSLLVQAQEAFFVYRNDGFFHGFFYDEVQEMRYSKIGVDSVENDAFVTYEIVLADTIYRIPLAAIDSIGFQQPEIRFNPKVKFIDKDGYAPYLTSVNPAHGCNFKDMPASMAPKVGDVFIGLPTDTKAEELYGNEGGSFAFVVDELDGWTYPDTDGHTAVMTVFYGHQVDKLSDIFEQYITVEQIGVDNQGNIHRRIAGCTEDGFPRELPAAEGSGEVTILNVSGTFTREWQPETNAKIDLSIDVTLKDKLRAAYNITWSQFLVTITNDFIATAKPSIGMALTSSFELSMDDVFTLPAIYFPAACPVFQTDPKPNLFLRGEGKLEARLNMPKVQMGVGQTTTIDSKAFFPVGITLHLVPTEDVEIDDEMVDISSEVNVSGYIQAGVEFKADIATANWFKKILSADIGLHLYVGPKMSGKITIPAEIPESQGLSLYESLNKSQIDVTFLSLDLEAKAKAKASFGGDPIERVFFNKNWPFVCDTARFAPTIGPTTAEYNMDTHEMVVHLRPAREKVLGCSTLSLDWRTTYDGDNWQNVGNWTVGQNDNDTVVDYIFRDIKYGKQYHFRPAVSIGRFGPIQVSSKELYFTPSLQMEMDRDSLTFGAAEDLQQDIQFNTNSERDAFYFSNGGKSWLSADITAIDEDYGTYLAFIQAEPNATLFDRETHTNEVYCPYFQFSPRMQTYKIAAYQQAPSLGDVSVQVSGGFYDSEGYLRQAEFNGHVTATAEGKNQVHVENILHSEETNYDYTYSLSMDIERVDTLDQNGNHPVLIQGTLITRAVSKDQRYDNITEITFVNKDNLADTQIYGDPTSSCQITAGTFQRYEDGVLTTDEVMDHTNGIVLGITVTP